MYAVHIYHRKYSAVLELLEAYVTHAAYVSGALALQVHPEIFARHFSFRQEVLGLHEVYSGRSSHAFARTRTVMMACSSPPSLSHLEESSSGPVLPAKD